MLPGNPERGGSRFRRSVLTAVLMQVTAAKGSQDWTFSKTSGATEPLKPAQPSALVGIWDCYAGVCVLDKVFDN